MSEFLLVACLVGAAAAFSVYGVTQIIAEGMRQYRERFQEQTQFKLREMFLFIDPRRLFALNLILVFVLAGLVWLVSGNPVVALLVCIALILLPRRLLNYFRQRRLERFEAQLPDALLMLSGGLKAGASLNSALQQLVREAEAPLSQEFGLLVREQRLGVSIDDSLQHLQKRIPLQSVLLLVSAMRIANETGGALAETLERTAQTLRSKAQIEGKISALTAQGKLQAWIVGALPLALMLVLHYLEPTEMEKLWHTTVGWIALAVILLFEAAGIYVIRRIIAIDV
ncbi:MAG: type II secretion system F family protein [Betaproteobacteria bacterium]|nr:type II secretion system F family protein [Betaproteobacteria bacterium]